ncbi:SDR family NAD(P)-dependent oxidoreductase [candidate division KSB1 bacterium]|nr:SDR family NAD(P)-dependent oxidoreductase [candidate division KSB1 bacterium]
MKLQNKTILITGASSGIGCELARQLAHESNRLILIARRDDLLRQLASTIPAHPHDHITFQCDVSDADQVKDICDWLISAGIDIDALILNAGVNSGFNIRAIDLATFQQQMQVNFFGAVSFVAHLVPQMIDRQSGIIAVTGSLAGYRGVPGAAAYSSSKGALMNFIDSIRIDLQKNNIQCTLISPGFVKTPMTDKNDFIMPFMIPVEKAATIIIRGLERRKTEIRFPWRMSTAARLGRRLPDALYARIMQNGRKKRCE